MKHMKNDDRAAASEELRQKIKQYNKLYKASFYCSLLDMSKSGFYNFMNRQSGLTTKKIEKLQEFFKDK